MIVFRNGEGEVFAMAVSSLSCDSTTPDAQNSRILAKSSTVTEDSVTSPRAPNSLASVEKSRNFMQIASAPAATDRNVVDLR